MQPEKLRHPLVFYFGHTAVFFVNKLRVARVIQDRVDSTIESTCAIGVDEMSWDDLNSGHYEWPTIDRLREYRKQVRALVDRVICNSQLELPITWSSPFWIVLMGIEHERIHLETSSVLFRQLPIDQVKVHELFARCTRLRSDRSTVPSNELVEVPAGTVHMGKPWAHHLYGWDNEYGTHTANVEAFKTSKFLVSNAEWLEFMQDGGYTNQKFWTEEGWGFVTYMKASHPVFWVDTGKDDPVTGERIYKYRAMAEEMEMPWDWPVDVNNLEAKAFCNWKAIKTGKPIRLPSEEEWFQLRQHATAVKAGLTAHEDDLPYWKQAPGNLNLEYFASSCPVDMFEHHNSGFFDVIGNVWQHCENAMAPYEGFKVHPAYDDFTVPTYDNMHNLIKGGSWISTGNEATTLARYAFRRHFYQHAGFRYVESKVVISVEAQQRETKEEDPIVANAMFDHYVAGDRLGAPNYSVKLANTVVGIVKGVQTSAAAASGGAESEEGECKVRTVPAPQTTRVLELGCSVGRGTFELAKTFDTAVGVDFSTRFIRIGMQLKATGKASFALPEVGKLDSFGKVDFTEAALSHLQGLANNVDFIQGDACNLDRKKINDFDVIVIASGFTRLYSPDKLLADINSRLRLGGILVLASDNDWVESSTPLSSWVGCYKDSKTGEIVHAVDALAASLATHFDRVTVEGVQEWELQQVQRKNARRSDISTMQVTAWRKMRE